MDAAVEIVDVQADTPQSGVSWAAIAAGAVAAAALTLVLVALGAGLGLSSISPWSDNGVSASTFEVGTGIYLVVVAVMSSAIGGYLAARLRTKWVGLHSNEVFFRDTAHGFFGVGVRDPDQRHGFGIYYRLSGQRDGSGNGRRRRAKFPTEQPGSDLCRQTVPNADGKLCFHRQCSCKRISFARAEQL
jgi:hypothetical protein